jgi:hypothetical protein
MGNNSGLQWIFMVDKETPVFAAASAVEDVVTIATVNLKSTWGKVMKNFKRQYHRLRYVHEVSHAH